MYKVLISNRDEYETKGIEWLLKSSLSTCLVETATERDSMVSKLEYFQPDLFIIELDMIEADLSNEFFQALKIIHPTIVALTLEPTFSQAKRAIDLGVTELLLKPVAPEIIMKTAKKLHRIHQNSQKDLHVNHGKRLDHSLISYDNLFLDNKQIPTNFICMGVKTEHSNKLPEVYGYLKSYPFKHPIDLFILSELILIISTNTLGTWKEEASRLMRDWQAISNESIAIALYSSEEEEKTVRMQYQETRRLLEQTFFIGYNQIIIEQEANHWTFIDPFLTPAEQQMCVEFLHQSNMEGIKDWLYKEFLQYKKPYPEPGFIRIRLTSILAQIRRHMKTYRITGEVIEKQYEELFQSILNSPVIYRIVNDLVFFITRILDLMKDRNESRLDTVAKVMHYLEGNYWDSNLTLNQMAKEVNRNSSYLSSLLTKKYGMAFRELLNDVRVKKAQKLLAETDMSVKEIAYLCGFNNQQYFNRVFRKAKGIPPLQYRQSKI